MCCTFVACTWSSPLTAAFCAKWHVVTLNILHTYVDSRCSFKTASQLACRCSCKTATRTKHVVARPNTLCDCGAKGHRQWQAANVPGPVMLWLLQLNLEVSWAPLHCGASPWDEGLHASGQTSLPLIFALIGNS